MRIRTVKPEFFKHEELFEAEKQSGLPLRLSFIGLFGVSDRNGRFKWRPRQIKIDILPYDDDIDFSMVMDALALYGFIIKYTSNGEEFGFIPSFLNHQTINSKEAQSTIIDPYSDDSTINACEGTCNSHESMVKAHVFPVLTRGEGKGKEGKGREKEGKEIYVETNVSDFNLFWDHYPKKVAKDDALKMWNSKKNKPSIEIIIKAVEQYKQSKDVIEGFTSNPATWINKGRWSDEFEPYRLKQSKTDVSMETYERAQEMKRQQANHNNFIDGEIA